MDSSNSLQRFNFSKSNGVDRLKYLSIDEWGPYKPFENGGLTEDDNFQGCWNLDLSSVIDTPNLNGVTSLSLFLFAFTGQTSVNNIGSWDVTNITQLDYFFNDNSSPGRLTTNSYNDLLIGWSSYGSSLQNGVFMELGTSNYSGVTAIAAKSYLTGTKGWVINDGGPV